MNDTNTLRLEALKLPREWSVWMVAVQTGLIGFLVSLLIQSKIRLGSTYLKGAIICFGLSIRHYRKLKRIIQPLFPIMSIAFAAWVLGSIPSIVQRLNRSEQGIYAFGIFDLPIAKNLRFGWFSFFEHSGFCWACRL